jgi:hypothetical protein
LPQSKPRVCGDTLGGSATVQVGGGLSPYQFNWQGFTQQDSILTRLDAGTYSVTVTDAQSCTASGTVIVDKTGGLHLSVSVQEISCHDAADGSFILTPDDGKPPYQWQWTNGPSSPSFGPLSPGTYTGTMTDAFGCNIVWVLPLTEPDVIDAHAILTPATDSFAIDGMITLDPVSGGTEPYQVMWSTGQQGIILNHVPPGLYTVTLTDAHNCTFTASYQLGFTVSTFQPNDQNKISVAPNPARDYLNISAPAGSRFMVFDLLGRPLLDLPIQSTVCSVWITALPAGLYEWKMFNSQGVPLKNGRLVKD